jgi:DNA-binding transcriptional LysR family regulator
VKLSVNLDDQIVDLVGSGFDLGIRVGAMGDSSLVARRLASNRRVLCASPAYLQTHGLPRTPAELATHDCLLLVGSQGRQDVWHFTDRKGRDIAQRVQGRFESNQGALLRDAVVAGLGIAMHSLWHVHEQLRSGQLQLLLPDYPIHTTGIFAVMPQRRLVPPRVRAFVDFLAGRFGDHPPWER